MLTDLKRVSFVFRPQILILCNTTDDHRALRHEKLLAFASQLKAGKTITCRQIILVENRYKIDRFSGKGLTVLATVIEGSFPHMTEDVAIAKNV